MRVGILILKTISTFLVCILTHAIILGVSPDFFQLYVEKIGGYTGGHTIHNYLVGIRYAFVSLILYGVVLLYLPGFIFYKVIVARIQPKGYSKLIGLGILVGILCLLPYALIPARREIGWWHFFPSSGFLITLPTAGMIGAVYGFLYKSWWVKLR